MIRKAIIVMLTLGAMGSFVLLIDSWRTHYRKSNPGWSLSLGSYHLLVYREVNKEIVPPRSTWGDAPGRVGISLGPRHWYDWYEITDLRAFAQNSVSYAFPGMEFKQFGSSLILELSLWYLLVFFAAYPTLAFVRGPLRRRWRRKRGLCVRCGYNLTGLTHPRCPECGTEIAVR